MAGHFIKNKVSSKVYLKNTNEFFKMNKIGKELEKHLGNFDQSTNILNNIYYLWIEESEKCYHSDGTGKVSVSNILTGK